MPGFELLKADAAIKVLCAYLLRSMIEAKTEQGIFLHLIQGSFLKTEVAGFLQSKAFLFFFIIKRKQKLNIFPMFSDLSYHVLSDSTLKTPRKVNKDGSSRGLVLVLISLSTTLPSSSPQRPSRAAQRQCLSDKVLVLTKDT